MKTHPLPLRILHAIRQPVALLLCLALTFFAAPRVWAQVAETLNYQGRVAVNGAAFTGTGQFRFALVNGAGTALWNSHASATTGLAVQAGLYSVRLGDTSLANMAAVPSALFSNADLRLRVWFDDGVNGLQQLAPDQRLAPVGYAHRAASADTVVSVPSSAIAPDSIQPSQLAHSRQTGAASGLASIPAAGGVLNVTFPQAFEIPPTVTLGGISVPAGNVTTTGFSLTIPPRDLIVDDGTPASSSVGRHRDAILVGGFPAIAYTDDTSGDLKYVRATNAEGTAWSAPIVVGVGGAASVGQFCSMTLVNNFPAIAYYDSTNKDLKYVRATDATGTAWGAPVTVASHATDDLGQYCILKYVVVSVSVRRPVIVYCDATAGTIRAKVGTSSDGTAWGSEQTPDPALTGQAASPYFDLHGTTLYYSHRANADLKAVDANPALGGWGPPTVLDDNFFDFFDARWVDVFSAGTGTAIAWADETGTAYSQILPSGTPSVMARTALWPGRVAFGALPAAVFSDPVLGNQFIESGENGIGWKEPASFPGAVSAPDGITTLRLADGSVLAVFHSTAGGGQLRVSGTRVPATDAWSAGLPAPVLAAGVVPGSITLGSLAPDVFAHFGTGNHAPGANAFAVGSDTSAVGENSWASGSLTTADGVNSTATGYFTKASGAYSTAMGWYTTASGENSTALGSFNTASGNKATVMGYYNSARGNTATALGHYNSADGPFATVMGFSNQASGHSSTAMGNYTLASGGASTAMGYGTTASNSVSTAMGSSTVASGSVSTAMGNYSVAIGDASTAMGYGTTANGDFSTAMGHNTTAGDFSTAMGSSTTAGGNTSTAMGYATTANGYVSTAMGYETTASGNYSTAMGHTTTASALYATAMGWATNASGNSSTAMGDHSRAETYGEVSLGFYPLANTGDVNSRVFADVLLEVGNGVSGTPSNALTIFKDGRMGLDNADTDALVTHLLTLPNIASATNGRGIANAWNTYSDSRIKSEQRPLSYGLREIMRLQPRAYTQHSGGVAGGKFVNDAKGGDTATIGFIAQEVEQVIPEAVQKPADPNNQLYGMTYDKLIPVLVKAAQELKTENDALKAHINESNAALRAVQQRLEKLERPARNR